MSLEIIADELTTLSRGLDSVSSEVSTAKISELASSVSDAMRSAGSGNTMSQAVAVFDAAITTFIVALEQDSDAAFAADDNFHTTDDAATNVLAGVEWADANSGIYTSK